MHGSKPVAAESLNELLAPCVDFSLSYPRPLIASLADKRATESI